MNWSLNINSMEQLKAITTSRPVKASEAMKNTADHVNSVEGIKQFVVNQIMNAAHLGEYELYCRHGLYNKVMVIKDFLLNEGFKVYEFEGIGSSKNWCKVSWDTPIGG